MYKNFCKYQSLGNDFIIFDLLDQHAIENPKPDFIGKICNRNFGIGADGVLLISQNKSGILEAQIYNADGSKAEVCFNGLRCVAHYLYTHKDFKNKFHILMGKRSVATSITEVAGEILISNEVGAGEYMGKCEVAITERVFDGHIVEIGNPHFIIEQEVSTEWLDRYGKEISEHKVFPNQTNVEFLWPGERSNEYNMLVYERGCGQTLACSSGAAAVTSFLWEKKIITPGQETVLSMRGGVVISLIDEDGVVTLRATARATFKGKILL